MWSCHGKEQIHKEMESTHSRNRCDIWELNIALKWLFILLGKEYIKKINDDSQTSQHTIQISDSIKSNL